MAEHEESDPVASMTSRWDTQLSFSDTITAAVGSEGKQRNFTIHTSIIIERSTFFASATSGRWDKTGKPIELADEDPYIFDTYLRCLYRDSLRLRLAGDRRSLDIYTTDELNDVFMLYAKTYVLADKLGDRVSANIIIDSLISDTFAANAIPGPECLEYVWGHTLSTSPLRMLCVDFWVNIPGSHCWDAAESKCELMPHEFLLEVARKTSRRIESGQDYKVGDAFDRGLICLDGGARYHQGDGQKTASSMESNGTDTE